MNNDVFILVTRPFGNARKHSAFFDYLNNEPNLRSITKNDNLRIKKDENYIIFEINSKKETQNPYQHERFTLEESHIRIDRLYYKPTSKLAHEKLFSHWHHTKTYRHPEKGIIRVHVYYHYSTYLYTYISTNNGIPEELIDPIRLNIILANSREIISLVHKLLDLFYKHKEQLNERFEKSMEAIIEPMHLKKTSAERLLIELKECENISAKVNELNEDFFDPRYKHIEKLILSIIRQKNKAQDIDASAKDAEPTPITTKVPQSKKTTNTPISQNITDKINLLSMDIENFLKIQSQLDSLEIYDRIQEFKDRILELYVSNNNPELEKKFLDLDKKIKSLPSLQHMLYQYAMTGEVEIFKRLFKKMQHELPLKFLGFLIYNIMQNGDKKLEQAHIEICKFLYEQSDHYRYAISCLDKILIYSSDTLSYSTFINLAQIGKNDLFILIYLQANIQNNVGLKLYGNHINLLTAVSRIPGSEKIINFLLDREIDPAGNISTNIQFIMSDPSVDQIKQYFYSNPKNQKELQESTGNERFLKHQYSHIGFTKSALYAYSLTDNIDSETFDRLAQKTKLSIVLFTLFNMLTNKLFAMIPTSTDTKEIVLANKDSAYKTLEEISTNKPNAHHLCLAIIETDPKRAKCLIILIEIIRKALNRADKERISQESIELSALKNLAKDQPDRIIYAIMRAQLHLQNYRQPSLAAHQGILIMFDQILGFDGKNADSVFPQEHVSLLKEGLSEYKDDFLKMSEFLSKQTPQGKPNKPTSTP